MSYQESRIVAYLISSLLVVSGYSLYLWRTLGGGAIDTTTIASSWGVAVLSAIGAQIVLSIVAAIGLNILQAVITREEAPTISDERDRLLDLRANNVAYAVFGIGFLIAMLLLALGQSPLLMFNLIVYALFGAAIVGQITHLYLSRRGF